MNIFKTCTKRGAFEIRGARKVGSTTAVRSIVAVLIFAVCLFFCPSFEVKAADDELILNENSVTLNPGDVFGVTIEEESYKGLDEWLLEYNMPKYMTSNADVCTVDNEGRISAVGAGTATITVTCAGMTGKIRCNVKSNGTLISKRTAQLYVGEDFYLSLLTVGSVTSRSYRVTDANSGASASSAFSITKQNAEGYRITAKKAGNYYIDLYNYEADGTTHSGRCYVTVTGSGLAAQEIAVAVGGTVELEFTKATFKSFEYIKGADIGDEVRGSTKYAVYEDKSGNRTCKITGVKVGTSVAEITSTSLSGEKIKETLYIRVTDPVWEAMPEYPVVGEKYVPTVTGIRKCSRITLVSQNESIIGAVNDDAGQCCFVPAGPGSVKIALLIDGKQFIQTVKCINPVLSEDAVLLKKGKKTSITVENIPPYMSVTYKSSNKKIAKVSESGTITAKKNGNAVITVTVNGSIVLKCNVTVGTKKSLKAVHEAEAVLGAKYSQEKRMSKGYYDCSSLVWRAYKAAGAPLTDDKAAPVAADLAKYLEKKATVISYKYVEADKLEPGDLIFYAGTTDNGRYKSICHVAMYFGDSVEKVSGKDKNVGKIIHAYSCVETGNYSNFRVNRIVLIVRPVK